MKKVHYFHVWIKTLTYNLAEMFLIYSYLWSKYLKMKNASPWQTSPWLISDFPVWREKLKKISWERGKLGAWVLIESKNCILSGTCSVEDISSLVNIQLHFTFRVQHIRLCYVIWELSQPYCHFWSVIFPRYNSQHFSAMHLCHFKMGLCQLLWSQVMTRKLILTT